MAEIHGTGPITPREKKLYEQEYKHGADLFQRALEQHVKSENMYQREEFKEVMDKAMQVLNETARELKQQTLLAQNEKIAGDYEAYQSNPTPSTKEVLDRDLDRAKESFP